MKMAENNKKVDKRGLLTIINSQSSQLNLVDGMVISCDNSLTDHSINGNYSRNNDNDIRNERIKKNDNNNVDDKKIINVETMLEYAGDFGRYQILLMVLFSIVNILSAFHYFAQTFIAIQPKDFRCDLSADNFNNSRDNNNTSNFFATNQTIFKNSDKCKSIYSVVDEIIVQNETTSIKSVSKNGGCSKFEYDKHFGYESIVTELNWVCDDSWKGALGQAMYFFGAVTGTFALGIVADKFGRIKSLLIAYLLALLGNAMTVVSNDLELFAVARYVAGLATDTNFVMMYIIVMEYVRPSMRTFGLNICIGIFYCLGCTIVPWLAVVLKTWRRFLVSISAAMVIVPTYYLILPESASWLLTQGRVEKALEGFSKIAKINGKIIPDDVIAEFKEAHQDGDKPAQASLKELFKGPKLRRKMMILAIYFMWKFVYSFIQLLVENYKNSDDNFHFFKMTLTLCYDAISRNVNVEGASPFLIFSVGSLTIFPACLIILGLQDKIGRKALFFSAVLSSAVLMSICGLMNAFLLPKKSEDMTTMTNVSIALSITARLCVVVAFNSGSQYAAELIPTIIRGRGVALIHVVGYAASFLSPLLLYLSKYWAPLPDLILGVLCFLCALATLLLPETLGRTLPVTVEDGELFGDGEKPCDFVCCNCSKN